MTCTHVVYSWLAGSFPSFQYPKKVLCLGLGTAFYVSMQKQLMKQHQKCNFHFVYVSDPEPWGIISRLKVLFCTENPWLVNTPLGRSHLVAMLHFLRIFPVVRQIVVFCFVLAWSLNWSYMVLGSLLLASLNSACPFCLQDCSIHKNIFFNQKQPLYPNILLSVSMTGTHKVTKTTFLQIPKWAKVRIDHNLPLSLSFRGWFTACGIASQSRQDIALLQWTWPSPTSQMAWRVLPQCHWQVGSGTGNWWFVTGRARSDLRWVRISPTEVHLLILLPETASS